MLTSLRLHCCAIPIRILITNCEFTGLIFISSVGVLSFKDFIISNGTSVMGLSVVLESFIELHMF